MEERFNTIANKEYEQIEKNPYKRPSSIRNKKINKIDIDYNAGPHNNDDYNLKGYNIEGGKKDKLKILEQNFFNLKNNKSSLIPYISYDFNYPSSRKEVNPRHADAIPESIMKKLFNSILRISINKKKSGTGFFMKIKVNNKIMNCMFTCFHVISAQDIQNQITIDIYFGEKDKEDHREIKLDKSKRFMKVYEKEDVTLIEIIDDDKISDEKYLTPDLNYEHGYERYLDQNFYLAGYPKNHDERCISSGRIIEIIFTENEKVNYKFYHKLDTRPGSSGSPITNDKGDVIGIHSDGIVLLFKNIGTFIGKVLDNLKAENNKNIHYSKGNNNDKVDKNHIKKPLFDDRFKKNFIQGEIYIKEEQINKEIRIINSYDNYKREEKEYSIQGNEREIMENCLIKINDEEIPFSYYYTFRYSGKYKIKYSFKHYLINTSYMFYSCKSLTNLDLSNFNTTNVTDMSYMFYSCKSLTNLNLSNFNTTNVTNMSCMFSNCNSLTNLDLSNFNTINVTDMSYMFYFCYSLTNLNLSNFNTTNVTNMSSMLSDYESLTNLDLSNFNTTNVIDMRSMFYFCYSLTNLDLSNFNTTNVTNMNSMFYSCKSLTNLNLSNFNTTNITDMSSMFSDCKSLTNLYLSKFNTTNVTDMSSMFYSCKSLTNLNLSSFNTTNVTDMRSMFSDCKSLTNLDLSKFNTTNVTNMSSMFYSCKSLTNLDLSNFNTTNVTDMSSMLYSCKSLTNLNLSNFNITNVTNMNSMFYSCKSLTNLNLPKNDKKTYNKIIYQYKHK